jgi:hypothetical protein
MYFSVGSESDRKCLWINERLLKMNIKIQIDVISNRTITKISYENLKIVKIYQWVVLNFNHHLNIRFQPIPRNSKTKIKKFDETKSLILKYYLNSSKNEMNLKSFQFSAKFILSNIPIVVKNFIYFLKLSPFFVYFFFFSKKKPFIFIKHVRIYHSCTYNIREFSSICLPTRFLILQIK